MINWIVVKLLPALLPVLFLVGEFSTQLKKPTKCELLYQMLVYVPQLYFSHRMHTRTHLSL